MNEKELRKQMEKLREFQTNENEQMLVEIYEEFERTNPIPPTDVINVYISSRGASFLTCPELWKELKKLMDYEEPKKDD